ncbi:head decoration protein [Streptomyces sp. Agncl-13]|uniref:head decoration protein n=1 Tax=Streptomyces sp. Agncl-13 TaxID=3400628 RepID=UPI003A8983FF
MRSKQAEAFAVCMLVSIRLACVGRYARRGVPENRVHYFQRGVGGQRRALGLVAVVVEPDRRQAGQLYRWVSAVGEVLRVAHLAVRRGGHGAPGGASCREQHLTPHGDRASPPHQRTTAQPGDPTESPLTRPARRNPAWISSRSPTPSPPPPTAPGSPPGTDSTAHSPSSSTSPCAPAARTTSPAASSSRATPSSPGIPLGRVTATGLYGPWDKAATGGRATFTGVLLAAVPFAPTSTRAGAALLWHGVAAAAHIPGGFNPADIAQSTAPIHFV